MLISQQHSSERRGKTVLMPISVKKLQTVQCCIRPDVITTRPDAHHSWISNQIFFTDMYMGRLLHPSGCHGNTVWMRSLIRQDVEKNYNPSDVRVTPSGRGPYYGNCMQQSCNHPDPRATSSGRGLYMESGKCIMERRLHSCSSGGT